MPSQPYQDRGHVSSTNGIHMRAFTLIAMTVIVGFASGCGTGGAFNRANTAASAGEWDVAVDQYRLALQSEQKVHHDVVPRRISPESTRLPWREMVWNRSTSPSISISMKLCSVSKPLAVKPVEETMSPERSFAEPPAVK